MAPPLSLFRNNRHWRGLSVRVDAAQLPATVDLVPPRWGFWAGVAVGLGWMVFTAEMVGPLELSLLTLVGLLIPGAGLILVLFALLALYERREVTFARDGVRVEGRSLAGRERWALPYTAFHGVLHRERVERRRRSTTTYQIIELLHEDPGKTLPLSVEAAEEAPRARWEDYARTLGLPALEESGDRLVGRATGDLDKSLRDLVDEGKVAQRFDPEARVPQGISIAHEAGKDQIGGERLRITLTEPRVPILFLIPSGLMGAFALVAVVTGGFDLVLLSIGVAFVALPALLYRLDQARPRRIVITRKTLTYIDSWQRIAPKGRSLKLEEIESVTIQGSGRRAWLVIAADRDRLTIGEGLPRRVLEWLKDYVTAAVATA